LKRMISASISARRTTGRPRARAAASSGLPFLMAEEISKAYSKAETQTTS